jgi:hypothetical protein
MFGMYTLDRSTCCGSTHQKHHDHHYHHDKMLITHVGQGWQLQLRHLDAWGQGDALQDVKCYSRQALSAITANNSR